MSDSLSKSLIYQPRLEAHLIVDHLFSGLNKNLTNLDILNTAFSKTLRKLWRTSTFLLMYLAKIPISTRSTADVFSTFTYLLLKSDLHNFSQMVFTCNVLQQITVVLSRFQYTYILTYAKAIL